MIEWYKIETEDRKYPLSHPGGAFVRYSFSQAVDAAAHCVINKIPYTITMIMEQTLSLPDLEEIIKKAKDERTS